MDIDLSAINASMRNAQPQTHPMQMNSSLRWGLHEAMGSLAWA